MAPVGGPGKGVVAGNAGKVTALRQTQPGDVGFQRMRSMPAGLRPRTVRRILLFGSLLLWVLLPTLVAAVYYLFIASDRYVVQVGFSVRSMDNMPVAGDLLGSLAGLSSVGTTTSDSYILLEFLESREVIDRLQEEADLRTIYTRDDIDYWSRLSPNEPVEDVVNYWQSRISTTYDNTSSLITFEVQAFRSEDALILANRLLVYCQELINDLSKKARDDAVSYAKEEVETAESRLRNIEEKLRQFRNTSNAVNPSASAAAQLELETGIKAQILDLRARLATLEKSLAEDAPSIVQLKKQIESYENQYTDLRAAIGTGTDTASLSQQLEEFERLSLEKKFAQEAYTVALSSLEQSRVQANRQQRFLAVYEEPRPPQEAIYPNRPLNIFIVFVVALLTWAIGVVLAYSVQDHMR